MGPLEFTRGDPITHKFFIEATSWQPGGRLFFAAKPLIDDDNTDNAAVIKKSWDDTAVVDYVDSKGTAYKQYNCYFSASDTNSIVSNGASSATYLGEFQFVSSSNGTPLTAPAGEDKLEVIVYFDVNKRIT